MLASSSFGRLPFVQLLCSIGAFPAEYVTDLNICSVLRCSVSGMLEEARAHLANIKVKKESKREEAMR